ncbi:hypothetical protein ABMZ84_17130 [Morganella morganii]|uniref:hypothetical protein n=1 Tax=Morganella morganii TaxID=582 RepID=UPI003EB8DD0C
MAQVATINTENPLKSQQINEIMEIYEVNYGDLKQQLEDKIKYNEEQNRKMIRCAENIVSQADAMFFVDAGHELTATNTLKNQISNIDDSKSIPIIEFDYTITFTVDSAKHEIGVSVSVETENGRIRFKVDGSDVDLSSHESPIIATINYMAFIFQRKIKNY